ncbi:hypothetical protein D2W70_06545 [Burkholderia pseudomallei]|nr:hypothetical protein D2W70_06545 [Burkholderia pseudomallei]RIV67011.1 hypothetical protein D2W49_00435 [Burkholderia pseudomallei]
MLLKPEYTFASVDESSLPDSVRYNRQMNLWLHARQRNRDRWHRVPMLVTSVTKKLMRSEYLGAKGFVRKVSLPRALLRRTNHVEYQATVGSTWYQRMVIL